MWSVRFTYGDRDIVCRGGVMVTVAMWLSVGCGLFGPRPAWAADPIRLHASAAWGRPAVDDGSVYYVSKAHELFAIDRVTGDERWRRRLSSQAGLTAGIDVVLWRDLVVTGDGAVLAFDAGTGEPRWRFAPPHDVPGRFIGEVVDEALLAGSTSGTIYALDLATGAVRWQTSLQTGRVTVFSPISSGDAVVASWTVFDEGPRSGGLVGLNVKDGAVRWRLPFPRTQSRLAASASGSPVLVGHATVVAAATDGAVYGVSPANGQVVWTLPPVPAARRGEEHEDVRVITAAPPLAVVTSLSGVLIAVEPEGQRQIWRYVSPEDGSVGFGLNVHGPWAFVPFASGRVLIIEWKTGREHRWVGSPTLRFDWPPVPAPGSTQRQMYLTGEDGLYVFDVDSER